TYVPETASLEERSKVKEVTILYRGSINPGEILNEPYDVFIDWGGNNLPIVIELLLNGGKPTASKLTETLAPQLRSSSNTLKKVMKLYPNSTIDIYGHSLGSMDAQYAIADLPEKDISRIKGAFFYQGPNIYTLLTKQQQNNVKKLNKLNKVYNYVDEKDLAARLYSFNQPTIGRLILVDSIKSENQHLWGGYQFKDGNLLTKGTNFLIDYEIDSKLNIISNLKVKFMENSGGNLSSSQEIFLDATEALVLTDGMKKVVQEKFEKLKKIYTNDMQEAKVLWNDTLENARFLGTNLSEYEIIVSLENGGVTSHNILEKPIDNAMEYLHIFNDINESYDKLLKKVEEAIKKIVENDEMIARQLGVV
ncbi:MAG: hypothetical protein ACRC5R_05810, partial [Mycoplasmatales bacterium]